MIKRRPAAIARTIRFSVAFLSLPGRPLSATLSDILEPMSAIPEPNLSQKMGYASFIPSEMRDIPSEMREWISSRES